MQRGQVCLKKKGLFVLLMVALLLILLVGVGLVIYPMLSSSYMERLQSEVRTQFQEILNEPQRKIWRRTGRLQNGITGSWRRERSWVAQPRMAFLTKRSWTLPERG